MDQDALFQVERTVERASAVIDRTGLYRYDLSRAWAPKVSRQVQWVMLNPSTADDKTDDATLRRCINYSKAWGFDGLVLNNLFAFRSTDPSQLLTAADPVGPENDRWLQERAGEAELTVVAWGSGPKRKWSLFDERVEAALKLIERPHALKLNTDGTPSHPVRLSSALRPVPYSSPALSAEPSPARQPTGLSLGRSIGL